MATDSADGVTEYTYDALGQLLTETKGSQTVSVTYDKYGNIQSKNGIPYSYGSDDANCCGWKNLLTAYNGKAITYDAYGNPINYQGTAATWEKGRQLKTFGANSYKYNNDGIRIQKRTATEIHDYILDGTNILKELVTDTGGCPKYTNEYLYDLDGTVCGIKYNDAAYYFYKNLQGDVIAITDANGAVVARYTYDAWGVPTTKEDTSGCNIATVNPFRYRGYYYDAETNLYYLQSRYYDPEVGRFINADEADAISIDDNVIAHNLFVYVENNPINNTDYQGNFSINTILKYLKKVVGFFGKAAEFLLKYFGIGRRKYNRRNKYNNKNDIYNFVYENKKALKKMKKSANTVAKIIEIIMLAVDLGSIVKKHSNQYKMVAELLFYGLVELICWAAPKIITFIVTKIFAVLFAVKSLIEKIFGYVFSKLKESSFAERVKSNYMNNVKESGMSFGDYFVALFQGMVGAMTT